MTATRSVLFLMANLGSEVQRFFSFRERGETERANACIERAFSIFEAIEKTDESNGGRREAEILKQLIEDVRNNTNQFDISRSDFENYFTPFALKALGTL